MKYESQVTHFAVYEIARILVPGVYFIFLVYFLAVSFSISFYPFDSWEIGLPAFFIGSMLAGLSFYAKETPKRRKAFLSNQPSQYLLERSRTLPGGTPLTDDESRKLYFYILNHYMPPTVHDKIFFFGMIYSTMISIRRTSFWFGLAGVGALMLQWTLLGRCTPAAIFSVVLIWLIYILNVRHNKADRKMQENYQDQIFWLQMNRSLIDRLISDRSHQDIEE